MLYTIIEPPFTLQFEAMSERELADYNRWFHEQKDSRIEILARTVQRSIGFESWKPDATRESLGQLGDWFRSQVRMRETTDEEKAEFAAAGGIPIPPPTHDLTNRSFSLAYDVGFYFAETLLRQIPTLKWMQLLKVTKRHVDYGQPVLVGFGKIPCNPIRLVVVQAYIFAKNHDDSRNILDTFDRLVREAINEAANK
jgi:hypothetical protein